MAHDFSEREWSTPELSRAQPRGGKALRFFLGPPGPRKYSLSEIFRDFKNRHVLAPRSWLHFIFFLALAFLFWYNSMNYWVAVIDDAYITFRYSDHFIHGQGLVYSLGERVEGYTNFTWMAMIAACIGLGFDPMFCAKVLGLACCLAAMAGVGCFAGLISRRRDLWNWLCVLPLAYNSHFAHWSMMGLETQLQVALLVWSYARFYKEIRDPRAWNLSPLLCSLAAMTRIESLYYLTPAAAYALVQMARRRVEFRRFLRWSLWSAAWFGGYFLWKLNYFGYQDLAPNTFYAKLGDWINYPRGVAHVKFWYFGHGAAFKNLWFIPILLCFLWARPLTLLILGPLILNAYYVYHVGGDWMPNYRFLQVTAPFLSLALIVAIRWVQEFIPDWGAWGRRPKPRGKNGKAWLLAEIAIFGAWGWLFFFKGKAILAGLPGEETNNTKMLWMISLAVFAMLALMRWAPSLESLWASRRRARPQPAAQPDFALAGFQWEKRRCVLWLILEWAIFMGFAVFLTATAPQWKSIHSAASGAAAQVFSLAGLRAASLRAGASASVSPWAYYYLVFAILALGWLIRFVSRGQFARTLIRWPIYGIIALAMYSSAMKQFKIGSVYLFDREPSPYDRNANWSEWKTIRGAMFSGFSPPLQNVADWMLKHCQRNSTIFMSDIGYPMWLNPHMSLIDVDGLTNKYIADAPSVRIHLKSRQRVWSEVEELIRREMPLPPGSETTLRERAHSEALAKKKPGASARELEISEREILNRLTGDLKKSSPLNKDQIARVKGEANRLYREQMLERNRRYVLKREPEYCNIFLNHKTNDVKTQGWPYPDISRVVFESPEFKEKYVETAQLNKYFTAWNHIHRRKDMPENVAPEEILDRLRTGIRRNPRMTYLYNEWLQAMRGGKNQWTVQDRALLLRSIGIFRYDVSFLNRIAEAARQAGEGDLALKAWRQSVEAQPGQEFIYNSIFEILRDQKREDEAFRIMERGALRASTSGLHFTLARLYDESNRTEDAARVLETAASREKTRAQDIQLWVKAAAYREKCKQPDKAIQAYQKVLAIHPGFPSALEALARLNAKPSAPVEKAKTNPAINPPDNNIKKPFKTPQPPAAKQADTSNREPNPQSNSAAKN